MQEARAQTLVALVTMVGSFAVIIIGLLTGKPIPDSVMTLITVSVSGVLGWYFAMRGAATGATVTNAAHAATVAAVTAAAHAVSDAGMAAGAGGIEHVTGAQPATE
jgi:hypothetical protein